MTTKRIIIHFKNKTIRCEEITDTETLEELMDGQCLNIKITRIVDFNNTVYNFDDISYIEFKEIGNGK